MASASASPIPKSRPIFNLDITDLGEYYPGVKSRGFSYRLGTIVLVTRSLEDRINLSALLRDRLALEATVITEEGSHILKLRVVKPIDVEVGDSKDVEVLTARLFDIIHKWQTGISSTLPDFSTVKWFYPLCFSVETRYVIDSLKVRCLKVLLAEKKEEVSKLDDAVCLIKSGKGPIPEYKDGDKDILSPEIQKSRAEYEQLEQAMTLYAIARTKIKELEKELEEATRSFDAIESDRHLLWGRNLFPWRQLDKLAKEMKRDGVSRAGAAGPATPRS